ncbi:TIM barrel protein [Pelomonas sp. KK5]|uniref:TIM barrel protein n=1 Tax=Pelomonas sp. KK5 TaxID=1855730 RepID=UPI00097C3A09|nr:TIM barrel protein [Pelomonas sp. KK5]
MKLSAVIEDLYMFNEAGAMPERIRAAAAAGLDRVEFHLWDKVDIDAVERALKETGVQLQSLVIGPRCGCVDKAREGYFLDALTGTIAMVRRLGAKGIVLAGGPAAQGHTDAQQREAMVYLLKKAASLAAAAGVMIWLEPLNSRIDHPGMFMNTAMEGLDIVEEVGSPAVRLLYDVYHSTVMGEDWREVLKRGHLIGYVQVADTNGRHEPGTGSIDWAAWLPALRAAGYDGDIGLEYRPSGSSVDSLQRTREVFGMAEAAAS